MAVEYSAALIDGPWRHSFIAANGARFHVATAGEEDSHRGAVLLLHGFPEFWWAWRHQLESLSAAGYRVIAMDLRGYGASDKPPLGHNIPTMARDAVSVLRSLGERRAVVAGAGTGGLIAWCLPTLAPDATRAVAALGVPHPLHLKESLRRIVRPGVRKHFYSFRLPVFSERAVEKGNFGVKLLREWGAPGWLSDDATRRYREALQIPSVARCAVDQYRWLVSAPYTAEGRRFAARLRPQIRVPVLHIQGAEDGCIRSERAREPSSRVSSAYRFELLPGVGHFLPEEAPDRVSSLMLRWLDGLDD